MNNREAKAWDLLCEELRRHLITKGWDKLSEIQEKAIPVILEGKNAILIAPTAGGKTEAAMLPAIQKIRAYKDEEGVHSKILCLVVVPLRALLNDLEPRIKLLAESLGLSCFKWHGDVSRSKKLTMKKDIPDILMTTPESLEGMFISQYVPHKEWFDHLQICVVDEAHNFLGGWRGVQLVSLLERLRMFCAFDFQRIAMSATVGNPKELIKILSGSSSRELEPVGGGGWQREKAREMTSRFFPGKDRNAVYSYLASLARGRKNICFCHSRGDCETLGFHFKSHNLNSFVHHSSVSKDVREKAETQMKYTDKPTTIVATSTLELGIDIGKLDNVSQYGSCPKASSFFQRLGRTGREEDKPQKYDMACITGDDLLISLAAMNLVGKGVVEPVHPGWKLYHLLAQQWLSMCLADYGLSKEDAFRIARLSPLFEDINEDELNELMDHLVAKDYLHVDRGRLYIGNELEKQYGKRNYMDLVVVFDTPPIYNVFYGRKEIGTVYSAFIHNLPEDSAFILAGKSWLTKKIDTYRQRVLVQPAELISKAPVWFGWGGGGVSFEVAQEIASVLSSDGELPWIYEQITKECLENIRYEYRAFPPQRKQILLSVNPPHLYTLRTFFGDAANSALSHILDAEGFKRIRMSYQGVLFTSEERNLSKIIIVINQHLKNLRDTDDPISYGLGLNADVREYKFSKFEDFLTDRLKHRFLAVNNANFIELQTVLRSIHFEEGKLISGEFGELPISSRIKLDS